MQSTIDISSTIITSSFRVFLSLCINSCFFSDICCTPSNLCIVVVFLLVINAKRLAALPVGAHIAILQPFCSNIEATAFKIVVFPVPGPPVNMKTPLHIAFLMASFWTLANFMFNLSSSSIIRFLNVSSSKLSLKLLSSKSFFAMNVSAR